MQNGEFGQPAAAPGEARPQRKRAVPKDRPVNSVVPMDPFAAFVPLLGLQAQGRDRTGFEASDADRLAGVLAIAVRSILNPPQRLVDLRDQLALAIASAEFEGSISFRRRPVRQVGMILGLSLKMSESFPGLAKDVLFPVQQLLFEVLELPLIHKFLVLGRTIFRLFRQHRGRAHRRLKPPRYINPTKRGLLIPNRNPLSTNLALHGPLGRTIRAFEFSQLHGSTGFNLVQYTF